MSESTLSEEELKKSEEEDFQPIGELLMKLAIELKANTEDQKEVEWDLEKELDQFKGKFKNVDDIKGFIEILKIIDLYGIYSYTLKEVLSDLITE